MRVKKSRAAAVTSSRGIRAVSHEVWLSYPPAQRLIRDITIGGVCQREYFVRVGPQIATIKNDTRALDKVTK